jgi:hypothetical protein
VRVVGGETTDPGKAPQIDGRGSHW